MRAKAFILGFCFFWSAGVAVAQSTSPPATPPAVTVVDNKWIKVRRRDLSTPTIAPPQVDETSGMVKPPNDLTDLKHTSVEVPSDVRSKAQRDDVRLLYNYFCWIKINNASGKKIRSIAYDYVFTEPSTKEELKRYSRRAFHEINTNETKWIWIGPELNPPQQVTLAGLKKDRRSAFDERVEIKCMLFTDGTGWRAPDAEPKTCEELVKITLEKNPHPRPGTDPGSP